MKKLVYTVGLPVVLALVGTALQADADEGKRLYGEKCRLCHSISGDGGMMAGKGGPLDGVGTKRDQNWLVSYLDDPKSKIPEALMPKIKLTGDERSQLVSFLLTLK